MRIVENRKKVKRNGLLSHMASITGLLILFGSLLLPVYLQTTTILTGLLLVIGLGLSMVGIYYANRWVRKPRPEEQLQKALKNLGEGYALFHYPELPSDHILLTPSEVFTLETINVGGVFSLKQGKWSENMTIGRAIRFIVEEHLGNPTRAATEEAAYIKSKLDHLEGLSGKVNVQPVVVFTHPLTKLEIDEQPIPICKVEKLIKHVKTKGIKFVQEDYDRVFDFLEKATI